MTKQKTKSITSLGLTTLITLTSINLGSISNVTALTDNVVEKKISTPIMISEVVADTHGIDMTIANGTDGYEYFELYNTSNEDIKLDDYAIYYVNGKSETEWKLPAHTVIKANSNLVVWVRNAENDKVDIQKFREYYGLNENTNVIKTDGIYGGFSNSQARDLCVKVRQTNQLIAQASYDKEDVGLKQGIHFAYNDGIQEKIIDSKAMVTPGKMNAQQTPNGHYHVDIQKDAKIDVNGKTNIESGEALVVNAKTNLSSLVTKAYLEAKLDNDDKKYEVEYIDGQYVSSIPVQDLFDKSSVKYRMVLSDGVNTIYSDFKDVSIHSSQPVDDNKAPVLTITEMLPDSENKNSLDAFEFIEVYNNSNRTIDLKDYKLLYHYPDKGDSSDVVWWSSDKSLNIPSKQSIVFWIKNEGNQTLTKKDFIQKFNTTLTEEQIIPIETAGMSNSGDRGVKIVTNIGEVIDKVIYSKADVKTDCGIKFQNEYDGNKYQSHVVSTGIANPGVVDIKPKVAAKLPETVEKMNIEDLTPKQFTDSEDLTFSVAVDSKDTSVKTVKLFVKDTHNSQYTSYDLQSTQDKKTFVKSINKEELYNKKSYSYYFEISNGYENTKTEEKEILNQNISNEDDMINVKDHQIINKTQQIIGTGDSLFIDDQDVTNQSVRSINGNAKIIFDASQTDVFFKNSVAVGNDVIGTFLDGTYDTWKTYAYNLDASYFDYDKKDITIAFHAGNKANALEHNIENNDDFVLKNIRLALPDGSTLRAKTMSAVKGIGAVDHTEENWKPDHPVTYPMPDSDEEIQMGDGTSKVEILYVTFELDESNFNAYRYQLDTTTLDDGKHAISSGKAQANIVVDNTAPEITSNIENGKTYHNGTIEATAKDAISDHTSIIATLDGQGIELPYAFRSLEMKAGEHVLSLTASDEVGNMSTREIKFIVPQENASVDDNMTPGNGETIYGDPTFTLQVNDPTDDLMNVSFKRGERYILGDKQIVESRGIAQTSGTNKDIFDENSKDGFPYQQFDVTVSESVSEDSIVRVDWKGKSTNKKTFMYAYNYSTGQWDQLKSTMSMNEQSIQLIGEVPVKNYMQDYKIKIMVQNGEGYTPMQYDAQSKITIGNVNDTPRSQYDFTFAIESDTQYYNEDYDNNPDQGNNGDYQHQLNIHDWILANRQRMNIQYMFHDGDIIDDEPNIKEWENANQAYKKLDDTKMPYGILAGNHDVGHLNGDYSNYSKYFGESRYNQNEWYGGSYKDNRGHYDLITVDGIDFIMMYMGWGIGDEEIQWMNDVLAQYPERKAILNFHEYLLASGGLGEEPQRVYNEVVAKNSNVCMVLSGHYHNAKTVVNEFDDDGDGVNDRSVYQMLFDYQGLEQGGWGYMRLMHFDVDNGKIIVRTYSPSRDDYNAKDETDIGDVDGIVGEEEFEIDFEALGIKSQKKELETENLDVNVYTQDTIGEVNNVKSNQQVEYTWKGAPEGIVGWYGEITDENGGLTRTNVNYVNIDKQVDSPQIIFPDESMNSIVVGTVFDALKDVKAFDAKGKDITDRLQVLGSVDIYKVGDYVLTYQVLDDYGNVAIATRKITVKERSESINPPIDDNQSQNNNHSSDVVLDPTGNNTQQSQNVNTSDQNKPFVFIYGLLVGLFGIVMNHKLKKKDE